MHKTYAPVAQWIEHRIPVPRVGGSSPFWRTMLCKFPSAFSARKLFCPGATDNATKNSSLFGSNSWEGTEADENATGIFIDLYFWRTRGGMRCPADGIELRARYMSAAGIQSVM